MRADLARRKLPEKKILLWDRPLRTRRTAHPEINRSVQITTGPVANRRNRLKASACSAGPKTATCPPPNPRSDATLSKVAGECEARTVVSDQRRLPGLSLWSENGSRLAASSRPQAAQVEDRAHRSPPPGHRKILGGDRTPVVDKSAGCRATPTRCGRNWGRENAPL